MLKILNIKSKIPAISLSTFNIIFAIWLSLGLNTGFFQKLTDLTPYQGIHQYLFIFASVIVITALYHLIFQVIHWSINLKLFAAFWIVVGGLNSYFVNSLGITITPDQIQNMVQTNPREALDLMNVHFFIWICFSIFIPLIILSLIRIKPDNFKKIVLTKLGHSAASFLIIVVLLFIYYVDYAAIFRVNRDLKGMVSPQNFVASSISYYKKQKPKKNLPLVRYGEDAHLTQTVNTKNKPKLMVLVVGETARAENFSLNGYNKDTNPNLAKLDIINFSNVSSCGTATAVSLPCMFSGMTKDNYDAQLARHREGLLDIAQRAGYKVTWIDNNSGCKGACDRVEQFVIPTELKTKWCSADGDCYDEILVDSLKSYINKIPKNSNQSHLIVLHQMGSHGPAYYKRATPKLQRFKPTCETNAIQGCTREELVNTYDNSILYTDFVLSQMIETLKSNAQFQTGFWYLSDHGESTGENGLYLHGAPYALAPSQQTRIPMLMWFSQSWQQNQAADYRCLTQLKKSELSQDNLFPTLINLLEIKTITANEQLNMLKQCQSNPSPSA